MAIRKVYNDVYTINEHSRMFNDPPAVVEFLSQSLKYCVGPISYVGTVDYPDDQELVDLSSRVHKRFGSSLDASKVKLLIDYVNRSSPEQSLKRAKESSANETDKCYFAAARFLRNDDRMRRLKEEHKANRINLLFEDTFENRVANDPIKNYSIEALFATFWYFKQKYLPNRSFYEKK